MALKRSKLRSAVTLIEVMVAIVIVVIAVLGASGYRYYSTLDTRRADFQNAAARIALLLCENWRGRGYDRTTDYKPDDYLDSANLTVAFSDVGPDYGLTNHLGQYEITTTNDGVHYWAALSYDDGAGGLRTLNVVVAWAQRQTGSAGDSAAAAGLDKTFKLTTYVSE